MPIKNVLVAVDGSEAAEKALDFAVELAEKFNAALQILNVSESLPIGAFYTEQTAVLGTSTPIISRDFRRIHEQILSKAVGHVKAVSPSLAVSTLLREGNPASEIVNVAREGRFDVVVIGHKGAGSRVKDFLLGSVSEKVAHLAPCAVFIVR